MIVEWCYAVVDRIGADRELVYITMDILDRFLAIQSSVKSYYLTDKKAYEIAVISSLLIATKMYASDYLCMADLVKMSSDSVTTRDIIDTAKDIYKSLNWDHHTIPTAARFAHALVQLLPTSVEERFKADVFESAVFQIEISVQEEFSSYQPPSLIAWMALENAMSGTMSHGEISRIRSLVSTVTGHQYNMLIRRRLANFQVNVIPPDDQEEMPALKPRFLKDEDITAVSDDLLANFQVNVIPPDDQEEMPALKPRFLKDEDITAVSDDDMSITASHSQESLVQQGTKRQTHEEEQHPSTQNCLHRTKRVKSLNHLDV